MDTAQDQLVNTGAFKDVNPVILTSGKIGIYYINTEKLLEDKGKFAEYGDDHESMIDHANEIYLKKGPFTEVIDELADQVAFTIGKGSYKKSDCIISGGQRRDWIFSGPVAAVLGVPHVALYKDGTIVGETEGKTAVHVVDLLTAASSCYRKEEDQEKGWIPWLREARAQVHDLYAVVSRQQGGEELLAQHKVTANSLIKIDREFLSQYSQNPERALAYREDDEAWTSKYLIEHGALELLPAFDPQNNKLDRAWKFLRRYEEVLKSAGKYEELEQKVKFEYNIDLEMRK